MDTNRVVVITGAAGGMGEHILERFLSNGDTVIATDVKDEALQELKSKQNHNAKLHVISGDISEEADCLKLAEFAREKAGHVDVFVNVAGYFPMQPFDEMTTADFRKVIDTNLTGVFLMIKAVHPLMKGRG